MNVREQVQLNATSLDVKQTEGERQRERMGWKAVNSPVLFFPLCNISLSLFFTVHILL